MGIMRYLHWVYIYILCCVEYVMCMGIYIQYLTVCCVEYVHVHVPCSKLCWIGLSQEAGHSSCLEYIHVCSGPNGFLCMYVCGFVSTTDCGHNISVVLWPLLSNNASFSLLYVYSTADICHSYINLM